MRLRAPTPEDAEVAHELMVAADLEDLGEADTTLADVRDEWERIELERDAVLAERDGAVIGYAVMRDEGRKGELSTADPEAELALLDWAEERTRAHGHDRHEQAVGRSARRRALLERRGYTYTRSYARMVRELTGDEPAGFRGYRPGDARRLYEIEEAAFATVPDFFPETFERFREEHLEVHDFDARLTRVADHGCALVRRWDEEAYIDLLAVEPGHTGRGLGTALLQAAFRAAADAGLRTASLGVLSDNPRALDLYTRAGMTERWRVDGYAKLVAPNG